MYIVVVSILLIKFKDIYCFKFLDYGYIKILGRNFNRNVTISGQKLER